MLDTPRMNTFVTLLRGINVSGKNSLRMADLQSLCEGLGCTDVVTYLQSGNVVFRHTSTAAGAHAEAIRAAILEKHGLDIPVHVIPRSQFVRIAASKPIFPGMDEAFLHITFLFAKPAGPLPPTLPKTGNEKAVLLGDHIAVYCPNGYGKTKLTNAYFERTLKTSATTRNWRTVQALRSLVVGTRAHEE